MFRFLMLLVLAVPALAVHGWCQHSRRCNHRHKDYKNHHEEDGDFHSLSWAVIKADRIASRVCLANVNHTTETFFTSHYLISLPLPDFDEEHISVKLKYRVLFIQALKGTEKVYSELKVLPEFAKGIGASWKFEDKVLLIYVPYEINFGTEVTKICNSPIDESEITIPKATIDVRFGEEETTVTSLSDDIF